jgi:molybdenum cofactor cytidylyltransferase
MLETGAIVLAAGLSRRMGDRNKLLCPISGIPMIRHMVVTYHTVTQSPICVVVGHQADLVTAALKDTPAEIHFNSDYAQGQATSVACGLRMLGRCDRFFIGLGDQPSLTPSNLETLLQAHTTGDPGKIAIPQHEGQRGNPIVVPDGLRAELLADPRAPGCKKFTREHPEHVRFLPLAESGFYADVDTPAAYAALATRPQEATS